MPKLHTRNVAYTFLNICEKLSKFCQVLKRCTQKKTGSFFLPHGVFAWEIWPSEKRGFVSKKTPWDIPQWWASTARSSKHYNITQSALRYTFYIHFPYLSFPLRIDPLRFQAGGHKMRLNLALVFWCLFCVVVRFFDWWMWAFVVSGLVFSIPSQETGNISEMTKFVINQWTDCE